MNLFENFFKFEWLDIFFKDLAIALLLIAIFVSLAWVVNSIAEMLAKRLDKKDLTAKLAEQKRFKKIKPTETDEELEKALDYKINKWGF